MPAHVHEHIVETDVLVVGGGLAGCFAAIKARGKGVNVVLVDKAYATMSGETPFAGDTAVFNPEWGHKLDEWMNQVSTIGEYVNNREWNEIVFKESYARYKDLVSWGVQFTKENGEPKRYPHPLTHLEYPDRNKFPPLVSESLHWSPNFPQVLRKQLLNVGVKIMDRIMITDLIKQDGKVVGAVGFPMESLDFYIFKSKATVICAGSGGFKTLGYPISPLTFDGHAMAYRVGAVITGKEFIDTHPTRADFPGYRSSPRPFLEDPRHFLQFRLRGKVGEALAVNAEGKKVLRRGQSWPMWLELEVEAHAGRAPVFRVDPQGRKTLLVAGAAEGMSTHATDGIWPINTKCASTIPGLYAAGDSLGTMWLGATYSGFGFASMFACVTGARAGIGAAEYALQAERPTVDEEELERLKEVTYAPIERKGGFSPRWVTQILQNLMIPYYVMHIKHEHRLLATLTLVEFIRDHLVPKLKANDPHELRLAHETKNMVLNAEMKLRASLFRTESRGSHYREDYPRRVDPDWLAWVMLKKENGKMKLWKEPIPEEWWPDLSEPYEERYPVRFPGE